MNVNFFNTITSDKVTKYTLGASAVLFFVGCIIIFAAYNFLPPFIPVFNQLPWGLERIGEKYMLSFAQLIASLFLIINIAIIRIIYNKLPLVARIIGATTLLIFILSVFFTVRTILLVL